MKKIALLFLSLVSFLFSSSCPLTQTYNNQTYIKDASLTSYNFYKIGNLYSPVCLVPSRADVSLECSFVNYDSSNDILVFKDTYHDGDICGYNVYNEPGFTHHSDRVVYIRVPDIEDNETCNLPNQYELSDDSCLDCSKSNNTQKCICEGLNRSYSNAHTDVPLGSGQIGGKCYSKWLSSCDDGMQFEYYKEISCSDDNSTNTTSPGGNSTEPNTNSTTPSNPNNPDDNSTSSGSGGDNPGSGNPGGNGNPDDNGSSGGFGGIGGSGDDDNSINSTDDNGTCEGDDCCEDWWCSEEKTADPERAFKMLEAEYEAIYSSFNDFRNLLKNGFTLNVPNGNYQTSSINYHGKEITFDVCGSFSMFSPIIQFIVTICGFLIALKIYLWRF